MCRTEKRSGVFLSVLRGMDLSKSHYIPSAEQLGQTAGVPDPSISRRMGETTCPTQQFWLFLMSFTSLQGPESSQRVLETQELWQHDYFSFLWRRFLLLFPNIIYSEAKPGFIMKYISHSIMTSPREVMWQLPFVCMSLSVCLSVKNNLNIYQQFIEIFRKFWQWAMEELFKLWWYSGIRVTLTFYPSKIKGQGALTYTILQAHMWYVRKMSCLAEVWPLQLVFCLDLDLQPFHHPSFITVITLNHSQSFFPD